MNELRCYTFTLFQLSSIQQGIQAGHAAVELVTKYNHVGLVRYWATDWKTLVCLNGGNVEELADWVSFFERKDNMLPWNPFYESEESLAGLMTSVAIVVPEHIFKMVSELRKPGTGKELKWVYPTDYTDWEIEFIDRLAKTSLAR